MFSRPACARSLSWLLASTLALAFAACSSPTSPDMPSSPWSLESRVPARSQTESGTGLEDEVVVTLVPGVDVESFAQEVGATLIEVEYNWCAAFEPIPPETPAQLLERLARDPRVVTSDPNTYLEPAESRQQSFAFDDGLGTTQTYLEQPATMALGVSRAHQVSKGWGVRIAILDTGADLAHPFLAGRVVATRDFVDGDSDPNETGNGLDDDGDGRVDEAIGHGTHVAGIVTLAAPAAELLVVRVLDADGRGDLVTVAAGVRWAQANGARVINLSLGSLETSDAVQYALELAEDAGVVCFAAAGNWGSEEPPEYPARSSHACAVVALDVTGQAAPFTSYGNHVAIGAPGVGVRSAFPGGGYVLWSGTSMSTPFVTAAAALLLAIHPSWNGDLVIERLQDTARDNDSLNPGMDDKLGAGALDIAAALEPDRQGSPGDPADELPMRRP